jgi:chromosomal replication initiation ATPase DnaA
MADAAEQIPFDLATRPAQGRSDFLVRPANKAAVMWIDQWPRWPAPALVISGPAASGKTHLASVWCAQTKAQWVAPDVLLSHSAEEIAARADHLVLDGIDPWIGDRDAETNLFHLYNICKESSLAGREQKRSLLITSRMNLAGADFALADLASRLRAAPAAMIEPPDDDLLASILIKLFHDRQIKVGEDVIRYILPRMDRSFAAAHDIVQKADHMALSQKRPVSVPLLRQVLAEMQRN